jgi:hypothetical protein
MKTTRYFREQVLRKRSYIQMEWCERILVHPLARVVQADGRMRFWGKVPEFGDRVLRVVTLADGETVHNAFPDRNFKTPAK